MWTKLSTMKRVGWTHERNNCESWSSLDPDLLVIVAKHSEHEYGQYAPVQEMCLVLESPHRGVTLQFETYYPHSDMDTMTNKEILHYLEHDINWLSTA